LKNGQEASVADLEGVAKAFVGESVKKVKEVR
jgi:hypothetical protein